MEKKSKLTTIINAFTGDLPLGELWYEERMKICSTCEYNSDNAEKSSWVKDVICSNLPHCTACGCCIDKKAAMKEETCGLIEIDKEPKWNALAVYTKGKDWNIENLTPTVATLSMEKDYFLLDYGILTEKSNTKIRVKLMNKNAEVLEASASCGCTKPTILHKEAEYAIMEIAVDRTAVSGKFSKTVRVVYNDENKDRQTFSIKIKGHKK